MSTTDHERIQAERAPIHTYRGGIVAAAVLGTWAATLGFALSSVDPSRTPILTVVLIPVLSFLNTGLFITAHDAMHGLVFPRHRRLNDFVGFVALGAYAAFDYRKLAAAHRFHHDSPASNDDPDYHDGTNTGFLHWLLRFVTRYMSWAQFAVIVGIALFLALALRVPIENVLFLWAVPLWLSVFQLFYFGTYLPHREPAAGYSNAHRARSNDYPEWLSFLTCYHFGYHLEHHSYPHVPWWRLPAVRRREREASRRKVAGTV